MKKISSYFRFVLPVLLIVGFLFTANNVSAVASFGSVSSGANSSSGASTIVLTKPSSTVSGDFLLAAIIFNSGEDKTINAPSGWTLVERTDNDDDIGMAVYRKVAGGSEPATYSWGIVSSGRASGGILRYTGVDTANPIVVSAESEGSDDDAEAPSVITTGSDQIVVLFYGQDDNETFSTPSGTTSRFNVSNSDNNGPRAFSADFVKSTAGATGTKTSDIGGGNEKWVAQTIVLKNAVVKTNPTLSVTNSPQTYAGSPISATVAGSVAGVVSDVKYDGSSTAPTNAGTYAVTADFAPTDTTNYNSLNDASAGNFVISQASSTTDVTCPASVTYTGSAQTPCSASVTGAGGLALTPTPSYADNTNVGTASASYTYAGDANHTGSSDSANFEIIAPEPTTGSIQITKYLCPEGTNVVRSVNGVDGIVPEGCVLDEGKTFGYVHGEQSDANAPYPELSAPITPAGSTDENGVLTISELSATGRYLIVETNDSNEQLPHNEVLGLYCVGDGDSSDNNDNQELTFVTAGETVHCVAYNEAEATPSEFVTVTIVKYINNDGHNPATAENTDSAVFPMTSTWDAENIGAGSGNFSLSPTGFNNPNPYQATTSDMTSGADYSVVENLSTTCTEENIGGYRLLGYKIGNSIESALASEIQESANLTEITIDKFIIVINEECGDLPPPPSCDANAEVILNGSFEEGTEIGSFSTLTSGDDTSITNWIVDSGSVDYIGSYWQASDGNRSIDLNGLEAGAVSQTIPTEIGETYVVTFYLSGNPDNQDSELASPTLKEVSVSATGNDGEPYSFDTSEAGNSTGDMMWEEHTYTFTATDANTTITFQSETSGAFGPALDNVSVKIICPDDNDDDNDDNDDDDNQGPTTGTIIIRKIVINDNGGVNTAVNFSFAIESEESMTPPIAFIQDGENALLGENTYYEQTPGLFTITESPNSEYTTSYDNCDFVLEAGDTEICTITNDDNEDPNVGGTTSGSSARTGTVLGASTGGEVLGAETSCGLTLELGKFMKKGYAGNDVAQVKILQQFLKDYLKLPNLVVDGIFGDATESAVKQFQSMSPHNEKILKPWGLTEATGVVYITTIIEINNIMCPELNIPIPSDLKPFN